MARNSQRIRETEVQAAICEYLILRRVFFSRTNNAPIYDKTKGVFRALPKHTQRGMADMWAVKSGNIYFIEVQRPDGKMSPDQHEFMRNAVLAGAEYVLAKSVEDVQRIGL
jgi:hypothetical protein